MSNQLETFSPFIHPLETARLHLGARVLHCMEDRPLDDEAITPAMQLGGSILGLAADVHIASSIEQGRLLRMSPDVLAKILADLLKDQIRGDLHERCLAEEALEGVAQSVGSHDLDTLFATVNQLETGVESSMVERVRDTYRATTRAGIIRRPDVAARHMNRSSATGLGAVRRNGIIDSPHVARDVIASHTTDWFDTRAAYRAGKPAYFIGFGHLPELARTVSDYLAVDENTLTVSSLVRHAATIPALPHPDGNGVRLTIHRHNTPLTRVA